MKAFLLGFRYWGGDEHLCHILVYANTESEARVKASESGKLRYNSGEVVSPEDFIMLTIL